MAVHFLLQTSGPADTEIFTPSLLCIFESLWNGLFFFTFDVRSVYIVAIER